MPETARGPDNASGRSALQRLRQRPRAGPASEKTGQTVAGRNTPWSEVGIFPYGLKESQLKEVAGNRPEGDWEINCWSAEAIETQAGRPSCGSMC